MRCCKGARKNRETQVPDPDATTQRGELLLDRWAKRDRDEDNKQNTSKDADIAQLSMNRTSSQAHAN